MSRVTRTTNPLPFEHMEPHRFEDLIRQLAYDFRTWRALEATGRSGGDEGYDIRGWEIVPRTEIEPLTEPDDVEEVSLPDTDRCWLIQCKREKSLGPAKVDAIFNSISPEERETLHGLVIAASCNVSKKSRDLLRERCREAGIAECHIWSRAEIEDMLFQPENDGLLFAYFGVSLTIRRRSVMSRLRSKLAAKRKAYRALGSEERNFQPILLRDPEEDRYPYLDNEASREQHLWRVVAFVGQHPFGLKFTARQYSAFLGLDGVRWDMADACNTHNIRFNDAWWEAGDEEEALRTELREYVAENIDKRESGTFEIEGIIPYEDIIDIDTDGDCYFQEPQIYVSYRDGSPPFKYSIARIRVAAVVDEVDGRPEITAPARTAHPQRENRVQVFPERFRKKTDD